MKTKQTIEEELKHLETKLLKLEVRKSPRKLSRMIHKDFIEFGSSGKIYDKSSIIKEMSKQKEYQYFIMNFYVQKLSKKIALVTYHASVELENGQKKYSLRSSIWKYDDERWQILFHQGTSISI